MMKKKLTRSNNKVFLGVCAGIAEYLGVDVTLVRLIAVVLVAITGFFPLTFIYLIAAAIMPAGHSSEEKESPLEGEFTEKK